MKIRLAEEWLYSCSGCEIAILNIGEGLIDLLTELDLVHMPILMDHKYNDPADDCKNSPSIPKADIGLVSGGVANEEQLAVLLAMREKCNTLVALGTCATHGGTATITTSCSTRWKWLYELMTPECPAPRTAWMAYWEYVSASLTSKVSRSAFWKRVRAECPGSACGYVGHMTADELKKRAATDEVDRCCPVCGMIHLTSEEIEEQEARKTCESPRYLEIQK